MKNILLTLLVLFSMTGASHAFVIINEIYADPANGLAGDANNDGVRSATQDEFVELLNDSTNTVDISGWKISDALQTRYTFLANTVLLPYEYIVVFGGGNPNLPSVKWQKTGSAGLNLNNTNETVSLFNNAMTLIDQVSYTTLANNDISIVRSPEQASISFLLHTIADTDHHKAFSPGTSVSGERFSQDVVTTPELPTYFYFLSALTALLFFKVSPNPIGRKQYA